MSTTTITAPIITAPIITAPIITAPIITAPIITAPIITEQPSTFTVFNDPQRQITAPLREVLTVNFKMLLPSLIHAHVCLKCLKLFSQHCKFSF